MFARPKDEKHKVNALERPRGVSRRRIIKENQRKKFRIASLFVLAGLSSPGRATRMMAKMRMRKQGTNSSRHVAHGRRFCRM